MPPSKDLRSCSITATILLLPVLCVITVMAIPLALAISKDPTPQAIIAGTIIIFLVSVIITLIWSWGKNDITNI